MNALPVLRSMFWHRGRWGITLEASRIFEVQGGETAKVGRAKVHFSLK